MRRTTPEVIIRAATLGALLFVSMCAAARAETGFVDVPGGKLAYEQCKPQKAAATVILIHDGLLDSSAWDGVWPLLCNTFHAIRFDQRGYGNSPPSTEAYSSIEDIGRLMDGLRIDSAALVGSSANGGRALTFALEYPTSVNALIISGPDIPDLPPSREFLSLVMPFIDRVMSYDIPGATDMALRFPHLVAPGNTAARAKVEALFRRKSHNFHIQRLQELDPPIVFRLGALKMKTLIVIGDADHANNVGHARTVHEKIAGSSLVTMKNAGHLSYVEHPQEFAALITSFLTTR